MSSKTTNYNLHKIDLTDAPPDITVLNENWDTIDAKLKDLDSNKASSTTVMNHVNDNSNPHDVTAEQIGALPLTGGALSGALTVMDNFNINKTYDNVEYKTYVRPVNYELGGEYTTGIIHYDDGVNNSQFLFNKNGVAFRDNVNSKLYQLFGQHNVATARANMGLGNTTGALPIANGGTGATTAQSAANNFCEVGTWTPKHQWATNMETPTITYNTQIGGYIRIGKMVHAWWKLKFTTTNGWTTNGDYVRIDGLPYNCLNNNNAGHLFTAVIPGDTTGKVYVCQSQAGYDHVGIMTTGGANLKLTSSNTGTFYFYGVITYQIQ